MKIAILGSSFDPPHNGHLAVAKYILKNLDIQKIILMPTHIHPFDKKISPSYHRLNMTKLLEEENIIVSDFEIKKNNTSYSINTLNAFNKKFPKDKFFWIIGSDQIEKFTDWKNWQEILKDFGLIIFPRSDIDIKEQLNKIPADKFLIKKIIIVNKKDFLLINISSSEIRKKIKKKMSIKNLVPKKIENYIIKNGLYV